MDDKKYWYVFIDMDEYYKVGRITSFLGDDYVVIKMHQDDLPDHSELFSLATLAEMTTFLFETEAEFNAWLAWLETPIKETKPKIVKLNPKDVH